MNFGFNSNVRVGNAVYHVQTEDRGPSHPFLDTVVYVAGRVVHKRSCSYEDLTSRVPEGEVLAAQLHERLAHQHREVIAQLEAGTLQLNVPGGARAKAVAGSSKQGVEVHLLNRKSWLESGNATLEVEMRHKGSAAAIGGADVEAFLETGKNRSESFRMRADAKGRAMLSFPLPPGMTDETSLVIRATDGDLYAELRYRLKPRRKHKAPMPAAK